MSRIRATAAIALIAFALAANTARADEIANFQARYELLHTAMNTRDPAAIKPLLTPDFAATDIQGSTKDADTMIADLAMVPVDTAHESKTIVDQVTITGTQATVGQHYSRTLERVGGDGVNHALTIKARSSDIWAKIGETWRLQKAQTRAMVVIRDGTEVRNLDLDKPAK